jgi:hypothetical protein
MERVYDFHELVGCANTLNHLSAIEYGDNGLQFRGCTINKKTYGQNFIRPSPMIRSQT